MLTISRLARYAGVTVRAVRHYHRLGLLPEPERTVSGYRSYGAEAVVLLRRIKVLADAGVPLARVRELADADPQTLREVAAEIDQELADRIAALQDTRAQLARVASGQDPYLPPVVMELAQQLRELGLSERSMALQREGWLLAITLYPHRIGEWIATQRWMLGDPDYREVMIMSDQAHDWPVDDPRIAEIARRTLDFMGKVPPEAVAFTGDDDTVAFELVTHFKTDGSPAWARVVELVQAGLAQRGHPTPFGSGEPGEMSTND